MGLIQAMSLAERADMGEIKLAAAVSMHLRCNHYPPVPEDMVPVCLRAIKFANKGDWSHNLKLPAGTTWRGKKMAPVSNVIESHHLEYFLEEK